MKKKIPSLKANFDSGEGDVRFPAGWNDLDCLMRSDLLRDWIGILSDEYQVACRGMRAEFAKYKKLTSRR